MDRVTIASNLLRIMPFFLSIALLLSLGTSPLKPAKVEAAESWRWQDINDQSVDLFSDPETSSAVLIFISPDCPIANSYQPALAKLAKDFEEQNVTFVMVHALPSVTVAQAKEHASKFEIKLPVVLDSDRSLAKRLDASVIPEAFVINRQGEVLYQGRIDDLHVGFGKKRVAPTRQDLRIALEEIAQGKSVSVPRTKAIGCLLPNK